MNLHEYYPINSGYSSGGQAQTPHGSVNQRRHRARRSQSRRPGLRPATRQIVLDGQGRSRRAAKNRQGEHGRLIAGGAGQG